MTVEWWDNRWRVVLETRDPSGVPYNNIYQHVPGSSAEDVIDYVLENYGGTTAGSPAFRDGWRVVRAWAVRESAVNEHVIEPILQPLFRRMPQKESGETA